MPLDNGTRRAFLGQMAISGGVLAIGPHLFESAQAANVNIINNKEIKYKNH